MHGLMLAGVVLTNTRTNHRYNAIAAVLAAVLMLTVFFPAAASGIEARQPTTVLIQLNPTADGAVQRALTARSARGLIAAKQIPSRSEIRTLTFDSREAAMRAILELRRDPAVAIAELNQTRVLHWEPLDEELYEFQQRWISQVDFPTAWNITTGDEKTVVAVIDSGVSLTHPDLADRLVEGYSAVDDGLGYSDIDGHGTHVAGIIAANGSNGVGTAGGAMDVRIMPIRVLAEDGNIAIDALADAIYWAVDNGADVINLSLGASTPSEVEHAAIRYAVNQGVPVISSAGNRASKISYPANYPETIAVGALDAAGNRAPFSSVVSTVDLAAPGTNIYSPHWDAEDGDGWSDELNNRSVSGTSFAAAVVTGAVALMVSVDASISPDEVRATLTGTAIDSGEPGNEAGVGAGMLNVEGALRETAFDAMYDTWFTSDNPVATGQVSRTWLWGVHPPADHAYEPYVEAQHGIRLVYYYDKSRMEITYPTAERNEEWYVTNGLLVSELISGEMQVGDAAFEPRQPAQVNVAGDPNDPNGPTYASFTNLLDAPPYLEGQPITATISRDGTVGDESDYAQYGVFADYLEPITNHRVANVFWNYLNSTGPIANEDGSVSEGSLFDPWFFATGLPITEAYWADVLVAGESREVLIQCFERRCLTYTPANPEGWQVEMGNVGQHYHAWRYAEVQPPAVDEPEPPADDSQDTDVPPPPDTGDTIYETTFENWPNQTFSEGTAFGANGAYHIRVTEQNAFIPQFAPGVSRTNLAASVNIQFVSGSNADACLSVRVAEAFSEAISYCVNESGDLFARYEAEAADGLQVETLFEVADFFDIEALGDGVQLTLIALDDDFWFLVGDEVVRYATYEHLISGEIGIYVQNYASEQAEYRFQNLLVQEVISPSIPEENAS